MLAETKVNFSTVSELANCLVRSCGISFRQAHSIVGKVVRILLDEKNETGPELFAELDNDCFRMEDGAFAYLVQLSPGGSLGVNKAENGNIIGGAAFGRNWG